MKVDATAALGAGGITASGPASLTNIGSGTFSATLDLSAIGAGGNLSAPFTITLSSGDKINGTLSMPASVISGGVSSTTGSATITGGTGAYANATGSFPNLTGTSDGSLTTGNLVLHINGGGTITTGGSGGGGGTPTGPTITAVQDAGGYTADIAQGSIFVVKGTGLSPNGFLQMSVPLPTTSNNVKITFTPAGGGTSTDAYLIYLYNQDGVNQLAGILPSAVATGNYNVTVTNGSDKSAAFAVTVVAHKPAIFTQNQQGNGLATVQDFVVGAAYPPVNRFTTGTASNTPISPAKPGQYMVAWATGLGPAPVPDDRGSGQGYDFIAHGVDVKVIVGGKTITPGYAGRTPNYAGEDQINFQLPSDVQTGCTVQFQISVDGKLSNPTFIAIAPSESADACVAPGLTTAQLQNLDQGGTFTIGSFALSQISMTAENTTLSLSSAGGSFTKITGFQLGSAARTFAAFSPGSCQVLHVSGTQDEISNPIAATNLDAGRITLSGPGGSGLSSTLFNQTAGNAYSLTFAFPGLPIPGAVNGSIVPGTYTMNGAGGADVGSFNAQVTVGAPLTINGGLPATITRSNGLDLNWTGGNSSDIVMILGYAGQNTGTGANAKTDATEFICTTTAGQGHFTVPASILNQLPAVSASAIQNGSATGFLEVTSTINPTQGNGLFDAPLTKGGKIDMGVFTALTGKGGTVAYQ